MLFAPLPVLPVEQPEIADVMCEDGSLPADSVSQLLSIVLAGAAEFQNMDRVVAALSDNFGQHRSNILIEQQGDIRHQPAFSDEVSAELSRRSLSMISL